MPDQGDQNIFGQAPASQQNAPQANGANADSETLTTLLGAIKNERGEPKYKSVNDALVALQHAQAFIPQLKSKEQELETKLNDALDKLNEMEELKRTVQTLTQTQASAAQQAPAGITEEQVAALVNRQLTVTQQQALEKQNIDSVVNAAKVAFGDKAQEVFYNKAQELGMSAADFNALAARTPAAVLTLLGVDKKSQTPRPTSQGINTDGFQPRQDSLVGRNPKQALVGSTMQDLREESDNSKRMVEELHAQGLTTHDLTDPKVYFKQFGKR